MHAEESPAHAGMDHLQRVNRTAPRREPRARGMDRVTSGRMWPSIESPAHAGMDEIAYRLEYLTSESPDDVEMGRTGGTEDALLIIGEITINALLRTPHLGGRGAFVGLVFFCPYCLWVSVRCAGVEQTHAPHLRATQPTFDCEGGWGLVPGSS